MGDHEVMGQPVVCPKCEIPACGKHCLARKRQAPHGPCTQPAGAGTDHPGWGNCKFHLGSTSSGKKHAETARQEAWDRLVDRIDPMLTHLERLAGSAESESVQFSAVRDWLDRAGMAAKHVHEHFGPGGGPIPVEVRAAELLERVKALRPPEPDKPEPPKPATRKPGKRRPATTAKSKVSKTRKSSKPRPAIPSE